MAILKCPDCGRMVSSMMPVHTCEPTESWKKENPRVRFIVKTRAGGYLKKNGRLSPLQRQAKRFTSVQAAEAAAEKFDRATPPRVVRFKLRLKCDVGCKRPVVVRLTYTQKDGDKSGGVYCLEHGEEKVALFRKHAKDGKVHIDRSPQKAKG